jgi:hypothetical protein
MQSPNISLESGEWKVGIPFICCDFIWEQGTEFERERNNKGRKVGEKGGLRDHLALCVCVPPLSLLGNGSVNTFPRKRITIIIVGRFLWVKWKSESRYDWRSVGQSVSRSWCRAPSGAHDQIWITVRQLLFCRFRGPPLTTGRVCYFS